MKNWLLVVLLALKGFSARAETSTANSPWSKVVMVGASASAGFVLSELFGGTNTTQCRLSYYLDAAIAAPHQPIKNLASALFFLGPEAQGPKQIEQAMAEKPTLVISVDFLFWYCYGTGRTDAERLARFENGLKLLDTFKCPLVVGDIPDASYATNTMLSQDQVPSPAAMSAANKRLKEWAASHPQVAIVPLADFMRTVMADQALTVHGQTLPAGKTRAILQDDELHPKPEGAAFLAVGVLDAYVSKQPAGVSTNDVRWNPTEVFHIGFATAQATSTKPSPK